jgi:hypothetical protein
MTDDDRRAPEAPNEPAAPAAPAPPAPAPTDYSVEVSPRQLAGGLAIVAAVLVLLVRSRRRRAATPDVKRDTD